jgi:hypothetical protein
VIRRCPTRPPGDRVDYSSQARDKLPEDPRNR